MSLEQALMGESQAVPPELALPAKPVEPEANPAEMEPSAEGDMAEMVKAQVDEKFKQIMAEGGDKGRDFLNEVQALLEKYSS